MKACKINTSLKKNASHLMLQNPRFTLKHSRQSKILLHQLAKWSNSKNETQRSISMLHTERLQSVKLQKIMSLQKMDQKFQWTLVSWEIWMIWLRRLTLQRKRLNLSLAIRLGENKNMLLTFLHFESRIW